MTNPRRVHIRWAAENEYCPIEVYQGLATVSGLRAGRSEAKESEPVRPVPAAFVDAVEPFVSRQVWGIIRLQILTGARPGEIVMMRGADLNMTGRVWEYVPQRHKTEHHGKRRTIFIGPQGQETVREFLKNDLTAYLFSPRDAKAEHYARLREARTTPMTPSGRNRTGQVSVANRQSDGNVR